MEIIAIINQKGGVGKSTTAEAIGAGIALKGFRVLYIDLDAQKNLSYTLGSKPQGVTSLEVLLGEATAQEAIQKAMQGVDLIPASVGLVGADTTIASVGKEYRLKEALDAIKDRYDYIIIDTPPALGILTINALTACTGVIIPAQADIYSLQGISQLNITIQTIKKYTNHAIRVLGIILTRYNARTIISREVADMIEEIAGQVGTKLYRTKIRECTALKEAQARRENIYTYAPKSNAAKDYTALIDEIIKQ